MQNYISQLNKRVLGFLPSNFSDDTLLKRDAY